MNKSQVAKNIYMKLFILNDYHTGTKLHYNTMLTKISNGIYGTANIGSFATPTITKTAFLLLVADYRNANNEYEAGGVDEKGAYDIAATNMTAALDTLKDYVEGLPAFSFDLINLSGFTPNKQSISASTVPGKPVFHELVHLGGGPVSVEFISPDTTGYYGLYVVEGEGLPTGTTFTNGVLDFPKGADVRLLHNANKQRVKTVHNLIIGQQYTAYAYAGNTAGVSLLSDGITFTSSNK